MEIWDVSFLGGWTRLVTGWLAVFVDPGANWAKNQGYCFFVDNYVACAMP
jgi:hypothetical protein